MTITEFLLARIAEDEETAKTAAWGAPHWEVRAGTEDVGLGIVTVEEKPRGVTYGEAGFDSVEENAAPHIARHDPARVLAECEAKRQIVRTYVRLNADPTKDYSETGLVVDYLREDVLQPLAAVYADHPDYQQEWGVPT